MNINLVFPEFFNIILKSYSGLIGLSTVSRSKLHLKKDELSRSQSPEITSGLSRRRNVYAKIWIAFGALRKNLNLEKRRLHNAASLMPKQYHNQITSGSPVIHHNELRLVTPLCYGNFVKWVKNVKDQSILRSRTPALTNC